MRRLVVGLLVFVSMTAALLTVPVYAAPVATPEPVETSTDAVDLGSLDAPAAEAEVQAGTTQPVVGVPAETPTLTYERTDVALFSLVGVTWAWDPAVTDTLVQVRVRAAGGDWGSWTQVSTETADQGDGVDTRAELRGGTSPLWTGPSTGVEVELVTRSGAQPTDVQLDLVDPGSSAADLALAAPAVTDQAHADVSMPAVYSRAQWGADESLRTWAPQYASTNKAVTIHHTADSNDYTADQVPAIMRSIYRYHAVSLGWGDIGYNVVVDKFGRLWEGRSGGLASTVMGAHAGGFNSFTFGVSMLGNYDLVPVPAATVESVAAFIAWKFSLFGVDPRGTTTLISSGGGTSRYAAGTSVSLPTIFAHRDVGNTACPGRYGFARMGEIRDRVAALMGPLDGPPSPQIVARYSAEPALRAALGAAVGGTRSEAGVVWQRYTNGRLYYSAATGVRLVTGSILDAYDRAGGPSALGAPLTDELTTPDTRGRYNHFAGGRSIYWTLTTGAHVVADDIRGLWSAVGWEVGALGYPVSAQNCGLRGGGCFQDFQGGSIYWTAAAGAHLVWTPLKASWGAYGYENGSLGYPMGNPVCGGPGGGCWQSFQGGVLYWSAISGGFAPSGAIRDEWVESGAEWGALGYPTSPVLCGLRSGGCFENFQNGAVYSTPALGAHSLVPQTLQAWAARGFENGRLGYPVASPVCVGPGGGCWQPFEGGSLYWSPVAGASAPTGVIRDLWVAVGAEWGLLGYPTDDVLCGLRAGGCFETFQNGSVYSSPASGTHLVLGAIRDRWAATGWENGPWRYPVGNPVRTGTTITQRFEGGTAVWDTAAGTVRFS